MTLAARDGSAEAEVGETYIKVYSSVATAINKAFHGSVARWGMEVMAREEGSFRRAVRRALDVGAYDRASVMGETLAVYLQFAGRLRERDWWAAWLGGELRKAAFIQAVAAREPDEAWAFLSRGEPGKAIEKLEALVKKPSQPSHPGRPRSTGWFPS